MLLPTTLVGSYPQPDWLIDREKLGMRAPPRIRAQELWRVGAPWLEQAQDDATILAIRDQEAAGIDVITDGEIRRESYSNRFATALEGVDPENPAIVPSRSGKPDMVPRVIGKIRRKHAVELRDLQFLRKHTDRKIKITVPGPFTMSVQAKDFFYNDEVAVAMAYAEAVNEEIKDLFAAGADVVQIDEPYMQARPDQARAYAIKAINRALEGVKGTTAVHVCFGYAALVKNKPEGYSFLPELEACHADQISIETAQPVIDLAVLKQLPTKKIVLGVISLGDNVVETPEVVADRVRRVLPYVPPDRLVIAPDCGMKYLPRDIAFEKLRAMVAGVAIVRAELSK